LEVEKLFSNILDLAKNKHINIENEERLKCELKRFGINDIKDYNKDLLSK
jgi:hypothetical protein